MAKYDIKQLEQEFASILDYMQDHHEKMRDHVRFYNSSCFYVKKGGDVKNKTDNSVNLLQGFADKNINYLSIFPTIKVPSFDSAPEVRELCSKNEKILYATWGLNAGRKIHKKWCFDGTIMSEAIGKTTFDFKTKQVKIEHIDPRYVYYQFANEDNDKVLAVWVAYVLTKKEIMDKYNIDVLPGELTSTAVTPDGTTIPVDSQERFYVIERWDEKVKAVWAGHTFLEQPHNHEYGFLPFDRAVFKESGSKFGNFFLEPLLSPQAEINDTLRRKANVLKRLGNPTLWGKGLIGKQFDEVKEAIKDGGGFIGLKQNGEIGFLKLDETKLFDEHMESQFQKMKEISGYPTATFGEMVGANTSGDALSMYFQPTSQAVASQWISLAEFYESINEKVLRLYEKFAKSEQIELYGKYPKATFSYSYDDEGNRGELVPNPMGFNLQFTGAEIGGYYTSQVIVPSSTPKDEIAYKRLLLDAVNANLFPRTLAYEEWGIVDPEETLDLLAQEQEDPRLNPQGLSQLAGAMGGQEGMMPNVGLDQEAGAEGSPLIQAEA